MLISDWSSDVCSSDLQNPADHQSFSLHNPIPQFFDWTMDETPDSQRFIHMQSLERLWKNFKSLWLRCFLVCAVLRVRWRAMRPMPMTSSGSRSSGRSRRAISGRSEEHTSELQSLMRNSYAVFCLKKK